MNKEYWVLRKVAGGGFRNSNEEYGPVLYRTKAIAEDVRDWSCADPSLWEAVKVTIEVE